MLILGACSSDPMYQVKKEMKDIVPIAWIWPCTSRQEEGGTVNKPFKTNLKSKTLRVEAVTYRINEKKKAV